MYTAATLAALFSGEHILPFPDKDVQHVCIDSRKAAWQPQAIFVALQGARTDGHKYIRDAWEQGIRTFLVQENIAKEHLPQANYILVQDVLLAFHRLAAFHRDQYDGTVIAIIGSNGKTWVKEWLYMLLSHQHRVYRSPGSYNSQVGVPLSVTGIPLDSRYAIIEAGISNPEEMDRLASIIQPEIVVFTHLGDAHDEGFPGGMEQKLREKLIMCRHASTIIFPDDEALVADTIRRDFPDAYHFSWSTDHHAIVSAKVFTEKDQAQISIEYDAKNYTVRIPFKGHVAVSNSIIAFTAVASLGIPPESVLPVFSELQPIDMRLKAEEAVQGCILINDSYSLDLNSLQFALESLEIAGQTQKKTLILSDHARGNEAIYEGLAKMITGAGIDKMICIGSRIGQVAENLSPDIDIRLYSDVDDFFRKGEVSNFHNEVILLKGARRFGFERIARSLRLRSHSTVLHVDFQALDNNLRYFYKLLRSGVKKIAVVKANAYGAGSLEVCRFLSWQHVDMLAVAVIDEGIELREAGISLPVIVLNPDPEGMDLILDHNLEPEIYNQFILDRLIRQCQYRQEQAVIHIKLDSGTHRLGFHPENITHLVDSLKQQEWVRVGSIFTHLSAADDQAFDQFTHDQVARFDQMYEALTMGIGYSPIRHVLSTSGILRFPQYQYEAVRMGIGLYGVGLPQHPELVPVHALRARILHIQEIGPGESVSYSRSFMNDRDRTIATVNLGYADGLPRVAGNVGCAFMVHGKMAPITGRVCMDMTMIDVTSIPEAQIGDEVTIFDKNHKIEVLARACGTIPYEIMTNLNPRIRKIYEHG